MHKAPSCGVVRTSLIALLAIVAWSAVVSAAAAATVFSPLSAPDTAQVADGDSVELGMRFTADVDGFVTGVRWYKGGVDNAGTHTGTLWNAAGESLGSVTFSGETASGWQQADFSTPIAITADAIYTVSYHAPQGHYSHSRQGFSSAIDSGHLHALSGATAGGNGLFTYAALPTFPTQSWQGSNYWVDVVFDTTASDVPEPPTDAPELTLFDEEDEPALTASDNDAVEVGVRFSVDADGDARGVRFYKGDGQVGTHFGHLWDAEGNMLASTIFANETAEGWQEARFATPVPLNHGETYTVSYFAPHGAYAATIGGFAVAKFNGVLRAQAGGVIGGNGVFRYANSGGYPNASYNDANYFVDVIYHQTAAVPAQAPLDPPAEDETHSLFDPATVPDNIDSGEPASLETGIRFQSDVAGYVRGIRFYKAAANTGTHVGNLWNAAGQNLASANFTSESSSGWQTLTFARPVHISADTIYTASYFAPNGHYSYTFGTLENGLDSPPLHAIASSAPGGDGVYRYGPGPRFPNETFHGAEYGVDVVFSAEQSAPADVHAPVVELESSATMEISDPAGESVQFSVRAVDDVDGVLTASCDPASGSNFAPGSHPISCEAFDSSGNRGSLHFTLVVQLVDAYSRVEAQLEESLPHVLEERFELGLPMGAQVGPLADDKLFMDVPDGAGGVQRIWAEGDFSYRDAGGVVRPIITQLDPIVDAWKPRSTPYVATLPTRYVDGMTWHVASMGAIRAVPVATRTSAVNGAVPVDFADRVLYPGVWPSVSVVATALGSGIKEHLIVSDTSAPRVLSWDFDLPVGATLLADSDGVSVVDAGGVHRRFALPPTARDSASNLVPIWYEAAGSRLSLHWSDTTRVGLDDVPVEYPLDLDPTYRPVITDEYEDLPAVGATTDGFGVTADCTSDQFMLRFVGAGTGLTARSFYGAGHVGGTASVACEIGGPPTGARWYSLFGEFTWNLQNQEFATIRDESLESPKSDSGWLMDGFDQSVGAGDQSGIGLVAWNASQSVGVPNGRVRVFMSKRTTEQFADGVNRSFMWKMTRSFIDDTPPTITDAQPSYASFDSLIAPGPRDVTALATDNGSGCSDLGVVDSMGTVIAYREPSGEVAPHQDLVVDEYDVEVSDCSFDDVLDFAPGAYRVEFRISDAAGNVATRTSRFTVADPIVSPVDGSSVAGSAVAVSLQVPQDLPAGTVTLEAVSVAAGTSWTISSGIPTGIQTRTWDTTRTQNGVVSLQLVHTGTDGARDILDESDVTINNVHPLQTSSLANASQTTINAGFTVLHQTGAIATQVEDISLRGFGGVNWGLSRSYHSQDLTGSQLGPGWKLSTEQRIVVGDDLIPVYVDGAGREWPYLKADDGSYDRSIGQVGRLRINPDPLDLLARPWQVVWPDGHTLSFDNNGLLVREQWATGIGITFGLWLVQSDGSKRKIVTDDSGHELTLETAPDGRLTQATDPIGRTWTYTYDSWDRLAQVANGDGVVAQAYEYKSLSPGAVIARVELPREGSILFTSADPAPTDGQPFERVTVATDPSLRDRGFSYTVGEDSLIAETVTTALAGRVEVSALDETGQGTEHTVAGITRVTEYNELGQVELTGIQTPSPTTPDTPDFVTETATVYSTAGVLLSEEDGEQNTTTYSDHDAFGNPRTIIDAAGEETHLTYDAIGRKLSEAPPEGGPTTWSYSGSSPLPVTMDPPVGATIAYSYSDTGQVTDQSWTDQTNVEHHLERASYDNAGQMLSSRKGDLEPATFTYDASGRTYTVTDPLGHVTTTEYTQDGLVMKVIDPRTFETTTTYDPSGQPVVAVDALGNTRISEFDAFGNVERLTDERGHHTVMEYDAQNQLRKSTDPLDRVTRYDYDDLGNQTSEADGENHTVSYTYDGNGNERSSLHPGGYTTSTTLTPLQNTYIDTDERGFSTTYGYDRMGRETSVKNAENETSETGYDAAGRVEWNENGNDERTTYMLDPAGRITQTTLGGKTVKASWDDAGRQRTRTDERNLTTELSYDDAGHVLSEQRPDGSHVIYTYDENGNRLTEENDLGEVTSFDYDEMNRVSSRTDPDGVRTSWTYDEAGNLIEQNSSTHGATTYHYDDANQRDEMTTPTGDVTTYSYDNRGLLELEQSPDKTIEYHYDARGNLDRVESGTSVSTYTHDGTGNVLTHTLADGSTITYTYDKVGRRVSEAHSARGATTWTYDLAGRVKTEVTSAGTTTYHYDARGRVEQIIYPGNLSATFSYDDAGNLLAVSDWAGVRSFTRDEAGRVESFTTLHGKPGSRSYDLAGRLIAQSYMNLANQLVVQSWSYDSLGRLESFNTGHGTIAYEWGEQGQIAGKTFPDGVVERFTYDGAGRLHRHWTDSAAVQTYTYDSIGRVTLIEEVNEPTDARTPLHRYTYTSDGQLASWWYKNDWYRTTYAYTAKGNLESFSRTMGTAPAGTNTPTENQRVAECMAPDGMVSCNYPNFQAEIGTLARSVPIGTDPTAFIGDRAIVARYLVSHPMRIRTFTHDSKDRVTDYRMWTNTDPYSIDRHWNYDVRGNQQYDHATYRISYDHANRPKSFGTNADDGTITWTHDGKLTKVDHPFTPDTIYDYDPEGRLLGSRTFSNFSPVIDYAWDTYGIAAIMNSEWTTPRFPIYNHRGDAIEYHYKPYPTDPVVTNKILYTPWGETENDTTFQVYKTLPMYGGRDGTIALNSFGSRTHQDYWMGARTYNAIQGRFRQVDPVPGQDALADTAYSYASNDPVNRTDPTGMVSEAAYYKPVSIALSAGTSIFSSLHANAEVITACASDALMIAGCAVLQSEGVQSKAANGALQAYRPHGECGDGTVCQVDYERHVNTWRHVFWNVLMMNELLGAHYSVTNAKTVAAKIGAAHERDGKRATSNECVKRYSPIDSWPLRVCRQAANRDAAVDKYNNMKARASVTQHSLIPMQTGILVQSGTARILNRKGMGRKTKQCNMPVSGSGTPYRCP